mmetsp:Transcript_18032/g.50394  ORF Transcript_18032/g.50394 Transcript_18032/m.50394 type:complete len:80 (-) Transcript_18032:2288-2527(-)|eukprot:822964-Pelagomonas_calceolata.AAC.1
MGGCKPVQLLCTLQRELQKAKDKATPPYKQAGDKTNKKLQSYTSTMVNGTSVVYKARINPSEHHCVHCLERAMAAALSI